MSYGMTAKLLEDVLPMDDPLNAFTIRRHDCDVAERLERELGKEQDCFIEGCQRDWAKLPAPDGPLTVGIDGGYVRGHRKQGQFEVIAGKSILAPRGSLQNRPMRITSKPANEREARQALLYPASGVAGKSFFPA
jgi:hypothetical protein